MGRAQTLHAGLSLRRQGGEVRRSSPQRARHSRQGGGEPETARTLESTLPYRPGAAGPGFAFPLSHSYTPTPDCRFQGECRETRMNSYCHCSSASRPVAEDRAPGHVVPESPAILPAVKGHLPSELTCFTSNDFSSLDCVRLHQAGPQRESPLLWKEP